MAFIQHIIQFLGKPFPVEESNQKKALTYLLVSLFITFFLYVFEPFGMNTLGSSKFIVCVGFGVAALVAMIFFELVVNKLLGVKNNPTNFTFGKWIVQLIGLMLTISLANFLYIRLAVFGYIDWQFFPNMIYGTFIIGVFPTTVIGGLALLKAERKYSDISDEINEKESFAAKQKDKLEYAIFDIPIRQIQYVESLQNYTQIAFIDKAGQFKINTHRATLKGVLDKVNGSSLIKCHRSYLVNKDHIISTSGNAQGLLLSLSQADKQVPVSRSFVSVFR